MSRTCTTLHVNTIIDWGDRRDSLRCDTLEARCREGFPHISPTEPAFSFKGCMHSHGAWLSYTLYISLPLS